MLSNLCDYPISIRESVLCWKAPSLGVSVFENQLVVDVVFEAPLPQKMILLSIGIRESVRQKRGGSLDTSSKSRYISCGGNYLGHSEPKISPAC